MLRFRHSGKLGDVIYALPAIKSCRRGILYLNCPGSYGFFEHHARQLIPLLQAQQYIHEVKVWEGEPFDHDLDEFRNFDPATTNLADCHLKVLGLSPAWRDKAWLIVDGFLPELSHTVTIARTVRHRGISGFWPEVFRQVEGRAIFVGSESEHEAFVSEVGPIRRYETPDLLHLARAIGSSRLFIGNQSCAYAMAEGLKHPAILEVRPGIENCLFQRSDCLPVCTEQDLGEIDRFVQTIRA